MDCLIIIGLFKLFISSEAFLLNSKELIEKAGISRATLNNYISCGIVPKPEVMPPNALDGAAPRLGYFNDEILMRIAEIQRLKKSGWSMSRIAEHFASGKEEAEQTCRSSRSGFAGIFKDSRSQSLN
jgi:DNA-binding transcriptional MerR regulator